MRIAALKLTLLLLLGGGWFNTAYAQKLKLPKIKTSTAITEHYAEVNGVRLHYAQAGHGKKLLLFVHGFPEFWYKYQAQLEEFSKSGEYTVVAPDLRGFNLSTKPAEVAQYQPRYVVEDLRQLAVHLGHPKFTLVAHDWGGYIAWWFAIVHPEHLSKLVILNASHPAIFQRELAHNPQQQAASAYMDFLVSPQAEQALAADNYQRLANVVFGPDPLTSPYTAAEQQAYRTAWAQPGALTGALNYYRAFRSLDSGLPTSSYQVRVPTLVIWGEQDKYVLTSNLTGLEQYVPDLTIKRIANGTHWVLHEQPALVNQYIRDFIH